MAPQGHDRPHDAWCRNWLHGTTTQKCNALKASTKLKHHHTQSVHALSSVIGPLPHLWASLWLILGGRLWVVASWGQSWSHKPSHGLIYGLLNSIPRFPSKIEWGWSSIIMWHMITVWSGFFPGKTDYFNIMVLLAQSIPNGNHFQPGWLDLDWFWLWRQQKLCRCILWQEHVSQHTHPLRAHKQSSSSMHEFLRK